MGPSLGSGEMLGPLRGGAPSLGSGEMFRPLRGAGMDQACRLAYN
jgi:hypothetical protein